MKRISSSPIYTVILTVIFIGYATVLITSCASQGKEVKTSTGQVAGVTKNQKGSEKAKPSVEQRLDAISIRLQKIEQALGLDESQEVVQDTKQDISQGSEVFDTGEVIGESDITEGDLPSVNSEDIFSPDSATEEDKTNSKSDAIYQKGDDTVSQTSSTTKPEALYRKARSLLLNNKFQAAENQFEIIAHSYPDHPLAVNSYYWMGECRYSTKDYKGAIAIFKELVEKYPNGRKVPDALLKTAYAYLSIKDKDNGREYLKRVIKQFPFTPAGEKAEQRLQSIK